MARTTSNYSTLSTTIGTLTNSDGLFRPDAGLASSGFFLGQLDILPQLDLPGNAIAPLTGLEVLIDSASAGANVNNAILIQIYSASVTYADRTNLTSGYLNVTTTPTNYIVGSSSLAGGVWKTGGNVNFETGSAAITRISSASSATDKLKLSVYIAGGGQTISLNNLRVRLTYTPATSPSTQMRRADEVISNTAPSGEDGFLITDNLLEGESGTSVSDESGSILVLGYPDLSIPDSATILGYEFQGQGINQGSGSTPTYGNIDLDVQIGTGSTFGTINTFRFTSGDENADKNIGFGGSTNLQGLDLTPAQANDLSVKFTYKSTTVPTSSLAIVGDAESIFPALRVYYANTNPSSYTRLQLRNRTTASEDFGANDSVTFELSNNITTTAYFNIEGVREGNSRKDIFNTASVTSLVSCSMVTESMHAGFIIEPNTTGSFVFTPTADIASGSIEFIAANSLVYSTEDITASGSVFGVDLELK